LRLIYYISDIFYKIIDNAKIKGEKTDLKQIATTPQTYNIFRQ